MKKFRDLGEALTASQGKTLYGGRDVLGEFWATELPPPPKPAPPPPKPAAVYRDYEFEPHTACYCNALGHMAPCSWCTDPERTEEDFNRGRSDR